VTAFTDTTGAQFLIPIVAVAVLGGIGQPYGAMLGALVIGITTEVAAAIFSPEYKDVVAFMILVMNVSAFTDTTGAQFLIPIVAVAVLGGIGQPYGAMLGALVIGIASEVAAAIFNPEYKDVVAFVILVIVLLARPQGILSEVATRKEVAA
jgi:branched-subunit amino acid ABC-type transport system permease component